MKKVIIQVLPSLQQGGVERGTIEIAEALQKEGIENYVISAGGKMVEELERLGVEHITLPVKTKNPFKMWWNSYRLARIFRDKEVALVHVRSRAPAWSVKWACRRLGIPYIASYHGRYGLSPRWFKEPYNRVMLQGEKVIAVSDFVRQHLKTEYQVPEEHICLIPRGADLNKFNPDLITDEKLQAFIQKYDIPMDKPIISLVGRLSRMKGHLEVLDALQKMNNKKVTLLFVGGNPKGDYEERLNAKLKEKSSETTVKIFGVSGDEIPMIYTLSQICVQPSLVPETFGRTIAEAQAMSRVVVAFAHGGACELIKDGQTGFLTPVGDSEALAHALDTILTMNKEERQQIETQARQSVVDNYSIQKMCERTLALYRSFLDKI